MKKKYRAISNYTDFSKGLNFIEGNVYELDTEYGLRLCRQKRMVEIREEPKQKELLSLEKSDGEEVPAETPAEVPAETSAEVPAETPAKTRKK